MDYVVIVNWIVFFLACVPFVFYGTSVMLFSVSIFYAKFFLHKKDKPSLAISELPGVSIIKPLMGVDPLLEENLESHFQLTYPKFEILFCVHDDHDPVITLLGKLKARFPKVDTTLFIGHDIYKWNGESYELTTEKQGQSEHAQNDIINPLVQNMSAGYENAQYGLIWISTSRIKANTDILMDMVAKILPEKIGMVHQMPYTIDKNGIAAGVEKIYFGCTMARDYLALGVLRFCCVVGMSYLLKKAALEDCKGLNYFGRFLAEDYFLSNALHAKGYGLRISAVPAQQNVATCSVVAYKDRMVRWLRLRLNMMLFLSITFEPMGQALISGVYGAWAIYHFTSFNPYMIFAIHVLIWATLDYILLRLIQNTSLPFNKLQYLLCWFIRESIMLFVFFEALINPSRVSWGKRTYRVKCGGHTELVADRTILPV